MTENSSQDELGFRVFLFSLTLAAVMMLILAVAKATGKVLNRLNVGLPIFLWIGIVTLSIQYPYYYDINLEYVGWLLLATSVLNAAPASELNEVNSFAKKIAWLVLGVGYFASGIGKLLFSPWQTGDALFLFYSSEILARFQFTAGLPGPVLTFATWLAVLAETGFLFSFFDRRARAIAWVLMSSLHLALAITSQLTEISLAVLIFHLFVFDQAWLNRDTWQKHIVATS